ncbi:SoxS protein [Paracoccus nototheniae]|uniref:SoxS protein n=1 Tax=Paracoccus nototheniae TaxID=2489002 RepID=UPI001F6152A1|nr:SoxS protein [Paracoccus nototheniae]
MPAAPWSMSRRRLLIAAGLAAWPGLLRAAPLDWQARPWQLMMVGSASCHYCRQWRAEIGPGFAASPAGRAAPLFEVDVDGPFPDGLALDRRPRITPSFILLSQGTERGRVEGYVGQTHFYPVLEDMMARSGLTLGGRAG